MTKMKSTFAICMMVLFATVALFPCTAGVELSKAGKLQSQAPNSSNALILSADGGEPQPPIPLPPSSVFGS